MMAYTWIIFDEINRLHNISCHANTENISMARNYILTVLRSEYERYITLKYFSKEWSNGHKIMKSTIQNRSSRYKPTLWQTESGKKDCIEIQSMDLLNSKYKFSKFENFQCKFCKF